MQQSELDFINTLRQSSRYVQQHRGKTCVIYIPGEFSNNSTSVSELSQDIGLLHNLGLKIVIALGANTQIEKAFKKAGLTSEFHHQFRITPSEHMGTFQQTIGLLRSEFEAQFSQASAHQPNPPTLVSGTWVIAQPKGVIDGVDYQHTGKLRKIRHHAITDCLNAGQVALLTPIAYSLTGDVFNLNTLEQACELATAINADKLMIYASEEQLKKLPKQLSLPELYNVMQNPANQAQAQLFEQVAKTNDQVKRVHLMNQNNPSALLLELFSINGSGTLIFSDRYHQLRGATLDDTGGIISLITPLENKGILVKRSRERLELEINNYVVLERDGTIIGCAALYQIDAENFELACLAVHPEYQGQELGTELLTAIENKAKKQHCKQLFLLTTHTQHWFIGHGFNEVEVTNLPTKKQSLYNYKRQSKVLVKPL